MNSPSRPSERTGSPRTLSTSTAVSTTVAPTAAAVSNGASGTRSGAANRPLGWRMSASPAPPGSEIERDVRAAPWTAGIAQIPAGRARRCPRRRCRARPAAPRSGDTRRGHHPASPRRARPSPRRRPAGPHGRRARAVATPPRAIRRAPLPASASTADVPSARTAAPAGASRRPRDPAPRTSRGHPGQSIGAGTERRRPQDQPDTRPCDAPIEVLRLQPERGVRGWARLLRGRRRRSLAQAAQVVAEACRERAVRRRSRGAG